VLAEVDKQDDDERRTVGTIGEHWGFVAILRSNLNKAGHDILDAAGILCKERTEASLAAPEVKQSESSSRAKTNQTRTSRLRTERGAPDI